MSTAKRFQVHERVPQRIRTTDSARRTRDTRLSAETGSYNPDMMGNTWVGNLKAELDSLTTADRKRALDAMRTVLDEYSNGSGTMGAGPFGSFATNIRPEMEFDVGATATPQSVNDANRRFWRDRLGCPEARANTPHRGARVTAADMNAANKSFWANQPAPFRLGGEWGKG